MRNKKTSILVISIISTILVGCLIKVLIENRIIDKIDKVVINKNPKDSVNEKDSFDVIKLQKTININNNEDKYSDSITGNGKLIHVKYNLGDNQNEGTIYQSQFPKLYIESLEVGTITDNIDDNRNIINWKKKEIQGQLLTGYMNSYNMRILKDNKVYMLDNNSELKEIKSYQKLIEEKNGDLNRFELSQDGNLDIHYFDNGKGVEKIGLINITDDKYYQIKEDTIRDINKLGFNILGMENEMIYVSMVDTQNEEPSTIGYIENNKLYTFFDENSAVKVKAGMDISYSNNNLLFSGYVEDNYGLWRYDIDKKELYKEVNFKYNNLIFFDINKDKDFVIIYNYGPDTLSTISIARLNGNLEVTNIQDITDIILDNKDKYNIRAIRAWIDNNRFYVERAEYKVINNEKTLEHSYYEVYEVKN